MYEPDDVDMGAGRMIPETSLTTPANKNLESGMWTKSIIWGPDVPFKDFTQLEFNHEDDIIPEERSSKLLMSFSRKNYLTMYSGNCSTSPAFQNGCSPD